MSFAQSISQNGPVQRESSSLDLEGLFNREGRGIEHIALWLFRASNQRVANVAFIGSGF